MTTTFRLPKEKIVLLFIALVIFPGFSQLRAQSAIDSLEIYDPFSNKARIRKILENYFSILGKNNQKKLDFYAIKIREAKKDLNKEQEAVYLIKTGDVDFRAGIYNSALTNYYLAHKIFEAVHDSIQAAFVELKIGRAYYFSDLERFADYSPKAYQILRSSKDIAHIAYSYHAEALYEQNEAKKVRLYKKAITLQREIVQNNPDDSTAKESLSIFLNASGNADEALRVAESIGNSWLIVLYLNNIGYDKVLNGQYQESLPIYFRSLKICKEERFKTLLRNTYDNLGRAYRLMGKLDKAIIYMELQHYVEESLFSEQFTLQASEFKTKIDAEKKELENDFLKKNQIVLTENIALEKLQKFLLLISLLGASLTTALIYVSRRKFKSVNKQLDEKNEKLAIVVNDLLVSESNLVKAQETAQMANWEWDIKNNLFSFSKQFPLIYGLEPYLLKTNFKSEILAKIHADDRQQVEDGFSENKSKRRLEADYRIMKNDKVCWIKAKRVFICDTSGEVTKIRGTVQDITDLKEEEATRLQIAAQMSFTKQLLESQEEERKRIAGELHDSLGQDILLIKNRAQIGLQNEAIDKVSLEQLNQINKETTQLLKIIREISFNLRPAHLESLGLTETITSVVKKANTTTKIDFSSNFENIDDTFTPENELHIFRIIQEGINNILKHSEAIHASVEIKNNPNEVSIVLLDDGKGFSVQEGISSFAGFGLTSIHNRTTILKGSITILSTLGKGTKIEIKIPKVVQ